MIITADQQKELFTSEDDMQWYKDAKFGIFVHWGPALLKTNVLSWGRNGERPAANKPANKGVDSEVYDNLYKQFNPTKFDADKWMKQVKSWGAKYIVFTAKHHDGFCFFDAEGTDYDIMNTPYGKDICKLLSDAAHKHGVKLFWYYSQPDWTHPDCLRENHYESYLPYMKTQVKQLFTEYGKIDGVFWDGLASKYWQWDSYHLLKDMKEWQPGLISNPRSGSSWPINDKRGDFDTPEQSLGPVNHNRYWEACLTMTDKWLYSPKGPIKSGETVLGMLIQVACNGGNLLLNLGPNGKGEFVDKEVEEVDKVGVYMKKYGYTLYNTTRGVYIGGDWGGSTQKENILYLHILEKYSDNAKAVIKLPKLKNQVVEVKGITDGFTKMEEETDHYVFYFNKVKFNQNVDNIVQVTFKNSLEGHERIETWNTMPVSLNEFSVKASSERNTKNSGKAIYSNKKNTFSEGIRLKAWWEADKEDNKPSLSLEFKSPKALKTILISENMRAHVTHKFNIQVKENGNWKTVYTGQYIGEGLRIKLAGKKVEGIRLDLIEFDSTPQITAFNVYE
ncbi:hypothetical protein NH26_20890 [Flammeovirga pacifica]|uniref:alpha-L-fucosidase n=2 Tax=Flammeovirga pacifica TaxID=915059 RepID=A0A1S1YSR4_FLAPC|nr:hypothetical protein NH26_20890 [Flammeovirga pacifica]